MNEGDLAMPLKILHLEDNRKDAELIQATLETAGIDCIVDLVGSREAYIESLSRGGFNVILCDYSIPAFNGLAALTLARETYPDIPFIFVSGTIGEERAIETYRKGATDYVLKEHLARLVPALRRALEEVRGREERRSAEQALRESEENYRHLVEDAIVGVYRANLHGKFLYVNGAMSRMLEFKSPADMLAGDDLTRYRNGESGEALLDRLRKERRTGNFQVAVSTKSGGRKTMLISAALEGETVSGMAVDLTDQKKLEDQLFQAQKMEAVGQLTGGIAHDFNNILSAIIGYGNLLKKKMAENDPLRPFVGQILAGSDRAANLIRSLLTFSRKQVTNPLTIDINESIRKVDVLLRRIIGEDIELRTSLHQEALFAKADAGQLEQVLMNLAANARDAMPDGGRLSIATEIVEGGADGHLRTCGESRRYAVITLSDTGAGMDDETREKIFEPFFTTKGPGKGTGLGLSMAYGIIKQHNGCIHCSSEPGKGTTFEIRIPLLSPGDETSGAAKGPVVQEDLQGTETILVVEDDELVRELALRVLTEFGYRVIEAVDGEDAVEKLLRHKDEVKLILCDVIMPKKNGGEAEKEFRRIAPGVRTVFLSGYPADFIQNKILIRDGRDILLKPISPRILLRKVREFLDHQ